MKGWSIAVVAALAVAGISAAPKKRPTPANPNAAIIAQAKTAAADSLKDPASAQFRSLTVATDGLGFKKVCGQINGKNSYGGYVGFRAFAYLINLGETVFAPDDEEDEKARNTLNRAGSGCPGFGDWHR